MKISLEILRFNPETDRGPHFESYEIDADPTDRLLDVLLNIKHAQDASLSLRKSCGHGVCGSDAMVVNGKERLACKTLIKDIAAAEGAKVRVEPLRTLPVQRDLMVDQERFFYLYRQVKPYLISREQTAEKERLQTPAERAQIDEPTKCILCAACYSACPVVQTVNPKFMGPAAIVQAARFLDDSRDQGFEERLPEVDYPDGIWPCESRFQCTLVCPRGIPVTKIINQSKRKIQAFRGQK